MSSLMQCVLNDIMDPRRHLTEEEFLASYDLDAEAISAVEGGWEPVDIGNPSNPSKPGIEWRTGGPAVYSQMWYTVVRGYYNGPIWYMYEPAGIGAHA